MELCGQTVAFICHTVNKLNNGTCTVMSKVKMVYGSAMSFLIVTASKFTIIILSLHYSRTLEIDTFEMICDIAM